jgi:protein-disulfide isomerase
MNLRPPVSELDHTYGKKSAPIELVEYGDYQCPHCGAAYPIIKKIQRELNGQLRLVFRNFPLRNVHPQALGAAVATEAAAMQGKFWEMHDVLFENQSALNHVSIIRYARGLDLNVTKFNVDVTLPELESKVLSDFQSGLRSGVNATPTFFVNGLKYEGDWRSGELREFLASIL